jgi:ornithine cyclodeaminase/alanine dehydrogenase-like protein (mu-crystallin family)
MWSAATLPITPPRFSTNQARRGSHDANASPRLRTRPAKQEIDPAVLASATVVAAVTAGLLTRTDVYAELGEIVCGRNPGRRTAEEIIVFDSTGMALQDVAASALVYQRAVERGVGVRVTLGVIWRVRYEHLREFLDMLPPW